MAEHAMRMVARRALCCYEPVLSKALAGRVRAPVSGAAHVPLHRKPRRALVGLVWSDRGLGAPPVGV